MRGMTVLSSVSARLTRGARRLDMLALTPRTSLRKAESLVRTGL